MPKFSGDPPGPTKVIHINVRDDIMERVKVAHKEGGQKDSSQSAFLGYLIGIGINVYEKRILPLETGNDVSVSESLGLPPRSETKQELEKQERDWKKETRRLMELMRIYKDNLMWGSLSPYEHLEGKIAYDTLCAALKAEGIDPKNLLNGTLFVGKKDKGKKKAVNE